MHYVAIRDEGDLSGKPMRPALIDSDSDRMMVWASSTFAGALYWAHARLGQHDPKEIMHVYEAVLDEASLCPDPNRKEMASSVMATSGTFGLLIGSYASQADVLTALGGHSGEDPYVDSMFAD